MGLTLLAQAAVLHLALRAFSAEDFGQYAAARRWASMMQPLLLVGAATMVPRWLAQHRLTRAVFLRLLTWLGGATLCLVAVALLWPALLEQLWFGGLRSDRGPSVALLVFAGGQALYALPMALWQGRAHLLAMALWQGVLAGALPALLMWHYRTVGPTAVMGITGLITGAVAAIVSAIHLKGLPTVPTTGAPVRLRTSAQRLPADFGLALLINAPAFTAIQWVGLAVGGRLALGTMLITLFGSLIGTLTRRALRYASRMTHLGRVHGLRRVARRIERVLWWSGGVGFTGAMLTLGGVVQWTDWLPAIEDWTATLLVASAAIPYVVYIGLRGFLDGQYERPVVARAVAWAWVGFALSVPVASLVMSPVRACALGGVVSLWVLALGTRRQVYGRLLPGAVEDWGPALWRLTQRTHH
jgi:hypothetical protein